LIGYAIGEAIHCDKFVHQPVVSLPAHSLWLVGICIVVRIAAESPAKLARPSARPIFHRLALASVSETVCEAGPKVTGAERARGQMQKISAGKFHFFNSLTHHSITSSASN